ncbi:MAG: ROK family protein [Acidimicrobiia bacterium]
MITVGIDVGGTFLKAAVVADGHLVAEYSDAVPESDVLDFVAGVAARLLVEHGADAVGVGLAGLVRWPEGVFVWGPHVSGEGIAYRSELAYRLGVPVVVDNDANLAAFAEATAGVAVGFEHVLMLTFGTGIGAGMVFGGQIYRGRSFAGEMGHMTVQPDGLLCACGRRGCWETLVSGARLDRLAGDLVSQAPDGTVARLVGRSIATGAHLSAAAGAGDQAARAILAEAGEWLGRGVANLIAVLDPDVVVVGGAVAQAGRWLLDPARTAIASHLTGSAHRESAPLLEARFGRLAGSVGAALLAATTNCRPVEERP